MTSKALKKESFQKGVRASGLLFRYDILHYGILVLSDYRKGALCMESGL